MAGGEWAPIRLGEVCTKIGSGATPRGGSDVYLRSGRYALIRSQNIYNNGFHRDGLAYIDEKHAAELDGVEVLKGDVLLNITGDSVARA
jgi:type I restriction enzyme, S subunit